MPRLTLKLLGAFQVFLDGKPIAGFDSDKTRALLAYLVVEAKHAHRRETLAGLLWPDVMEASARQSLSQALSNLRKLLRDTDNEPPFLLTTRDTVQFNPEANYELDADPAAIQQQASSGHLTEQNNTLLPGFTLAGADGFEEWLLLQREATQRDWIEALETQAQRQLADEQYSAAIATAQHLLQIDPWREQAHLYLMRAYAEHGQRSEALQQFEKCKKILHDELGIAPSAEMQTMAAQIKSGSGPLASKPASIVSTPSNQSQPQSTSSVARPALLPNTLTPFVGRTRELAELRQLLTNPEVRLITLTGAGGMGKTRLAIQAASEATALPDTQFADGLAYVSLGNVREAERVAAVIIGALGLPLDSQVSPEAQLFGFLQEKAMLLILDNFEHLLATENSLAFLSALFQSVAQVKLLVTSREALGAPGEWVVALTGLGEDAHALFVLSARRVRADLNFNEEDADIRRICHTLDGLPLGIELAASWARMLSCKEIADELAQNLDLLESTARDLPERHRSMTGVFEYSWRLLSEHECRVMMALSIFRGGFSRDAAKQVANANLLDLSALVSKSMVRRTEQGRYDLHNVVRQNARRHLSDAGQATVTEIADRHLNYMLGYAQTAAGYLLGAEQTQWVQRLAMELDNIRVALDWAIANPGPRTQQALQLITALQGYWQVQGHLSEMRDYLAQVMQQARRQTIPSALWAKALCTAGMLALWQDDGAAAGPLLEESRQRWVSNEGNGAAGIAHVLLGLGEIASANSQYNEARQRYEEAYRRFEASGDVWGMSESLLGIARHSLADHAANGVGDSDTSRIVHNRQLLEQSLALKRQLNDARGTAWVLSWLSTLLHEQNDPQGARALLLECLQIQEALGDRMGSARTLNRLAEGYRQVGDYSQADHYYTESLQRYRDLGSSRGMAMVLHNRAHIQLAQGQVNEAQAQFVESLRHYQRVADIEGMALALAGLGAVALAERNLKRAVTRFAAADAAMRSINYYFEATDRMEYERHVAEAKAQLGADEFAERWAAGSAASLDQVVQDALH